MANLVNQTGADSSRRNDEGDQSDGEADQTILCIICWGAARDPCLCFCGNTFCAECIYTWIVQQRNNAKCPMCNEKICLNSLIPIEGGGVYAPYNALAETTVPRASRFIKDLIPEPFLRLKLLPLQLPHEAQETGPIHFFVECSVFRRMSILVLMFLFYLMNLYTRTDA